MFTGAKAPVFFTAMDGGNAENAGAFFGGRLDGQRCRKTQEHFLGAMDGGLSRPSMASEALGLLPGENAGAFFGGQETSCASTFRQSRRRGAGAIGQRLIGFVELVIVP